MADLLLAGGDFLTSEEANQLASDEHASVVMLAGPPDCGKTTLIAAIYGEFLEGPLANCRFAGSRTLRGFEQRHAAARTPSDAPAPGTQRTPLGEEGRFLHLRIAVPDAVRMKNLLIADWSGETYAYIANSRQYAESMPTLKGVDHFVVLIDGGLMKDERRHQVQAEANSLIRSCLDSGQLRADVSCSIVLSKWDLAASGKGSIRGKRSVAEIEENLTTLFAERFGSMEFFRTSVFRSKSGRIPAGHGLGLLVTRWLEDLSVSVAATEEEGTED